MRSVLFRARDTCGFINTRHSTREKNDHLLKMAAMTDFVQFSLDGVDSLLRTTTCVFFNIVNFSFSVLFCVFCTLTEVIFIIRLPSRFYLSIEISLNQS